MSEFFSNMLQPWQWAVLASVPPAIVALYFLKLRRQPLEVPSTYLWRRTIEDLHVNSMWQRLRQNLLLFLQLLLVALVMLACLRPGWRGEKLVGDRFVFLIDTSASMNATDVKPSRLGAAKQRVDKMVEQMKRGDKAIIVSFSDRAQVEQPFTENRQLLRRRLAAIKPTSRTSDIGEALKFAAGLANPGRSGEAGDAPAADAMPASLIILSDGRFQSTPDFAMGNLRPMYVPIGNAAAVNVGVLAFRVDRSPQQPDRMQAFAQLENYTDQERTAEVALYLNDNLLDAAHVRLPPTGTGGAEFVMESVDEGTLRLEVQVADDLAVDNVAFAVVRPPRKAKVLLISPNNDALELALSTEASLKIADVQIGTPDVLKSKKYLDQSAAGAYDMVIYDQCAPDVMPQANTFFIGTIPADGGWKAGKKQTFPQIIDTDQSHPLTQFIELGDVRWILEGTPLEVPRGGTVLIDSDAGPLLAIAARDGFEDVVLGFGILNAQQQGQPTPNTDWVIRTSFPLFIKNVLSYLGGNRSVDSLRSVLTGEPIALRTESPVGSIRIENPTHEVTQIRRGPQNTFVYGNTDQIGVYEIREGSRSEVSNRFAVNLFNSTESNIRPRPFIKTEYDQIEGRTNSETTRREAWRGLVLVALGVLLVEWYIYNRRVYI